MRAQLSPWEEEKEEEEEGIWGSSAFFLRAEWLAAKRWLTGCREQLAACSHLSFIAKRPK